MEAKAMHGKCTAIATMDRRPTPQDAELQLMQAEDAMLRFPYLLL